MPIVRKHPRAETDLLAIWRYIAMDSPVQADRFLDRLDATFSRLADLPYMGKSRPDFSPGLRVFPVGAYLVFYRPAVDGVDIVRGLHSRRHITRRFF